MSQISRFGAITISRLIEAMTIVKFVYFYFSALAWVPKICLK